jgi:DNA-binding winged helix-turn-helix (wHTH) protein/TolB-like protein/Tfp pilus assembly protein PilF
MESLTHSYTFGTFRLDVRERALYADGQPLVLTPKAVETLIALVERHGHLVTKDELFQRVWPDSFVEENNLAQNISQLRRVLGEGASGGRFITTVPKRGYRFVAQVTEVVEQGREALRDPSNGPTLFESAETSRAARLPDARAWKGRMVWAGAAGAVVVVAVLATSRMRDVAVGEMPRSATDAALDERGRPTLLHIAVLPFANIGSDDDKYVAAGLTEEITNQLAGLNRLAVRSSTTIAINDRRGKPAQRVATELGVDYLLEGSVRWQPASEGDRVTITPKLIRVSDLATIWTERYEAPLASLATVRAQIAQQVVSVLQVALDARERRAVEARPTTDTDAYLAFLRGIAAYRDGFSDTTNQARARADLEQAVARDPDFALAWSWLARTYTSQYRSGADRTDGTRTAGYRAARTAIALDRDLADAHLALGQALFGDREYVAARAELEIARVGLPNSAELWQLLGHVAQSEGRWQEARAAFLRGFELDPPATAQWVTVHYLHMRDYAEARRFIGIARAANQGGSVVPDAWLRFSERGDVDAARGTLEAALGAKSPADARVRGLLARLEWFDGRYQRALSLIHEMDAAGAWMSPNLRFPAAVAAGQVYESMGRHQDVLESYAVALPDLLARERVSPDDYQVQAALALTALGLRRPADAQRHAKRAAALLPVSKDAVEGPLYLYLLAQVQAQTGEREAALVTLDQLFDVPGFYNEHWVQRDPGFAPLWNRESFRARVARWAMQRGDVLLEQVDRADSPFK